MLTSGLVPAGERDVQGLLPGVLRTGVEHRARLLGALHEVGDGDLHEIDPSRPEGLGADPVAGLRVTVTAALFDGRGTSRPRSFIRSTME